ncbi:MAG: efflux RND transporter periplasmic adaptor subunit [Niabella sp.]
MAGILLLISCGNEQQPPNTTKQVPSVLVERRNVVGHQYFPTTIEGKNNNAVRAKISGYIKDMYVDEGQHVHQGQALFRLETNTLAENASAARSGIAAAKASVDAAQAGVEAADIEVKKLIPLVEKQIISAVQLETAKANLLRAKGQLSQAKAAWLQAQANYKSAEANVDYAVIRAPVNGVVGKINWRKGALVGPTDATPITTVSDIKELYAYFSMNEAEYLDFLKDIPGTGIQAKLNQLPLVELEMANGSIYPQKGEIKTVTGQVDPTTGTVQFRASFPNSEGLLTNGNTGRIIIPKYYNNVLVVPETGLFEQQGNVFLYKVVKDTARSVMVKIAVRENNLGVIADGVNEGDTVLATGVSIIRPGSHVKPMVTAIDSVTNNIKPVF